MAIDHTSPDSEARSRARLDRLTAAWRSRSAAAPVTTAQVPPSASATSLAAGAEAVGGARTPSCGLRKQVGMGTPLRTAGCPRHHCRASS